MENVITTTVSPEATEDKKLYWADRDQLDADYYNDGDYLRSYCQEIDWAYEDRGVYGGGGIIKDLLEALIKDNNVGYLREYTEEELFEEVADDWAGVRDYIFYKSGLTDKITPENVKKAWEVGRADGSLEEIMTTLLGDKVYKIVCRGYCQGDYAEVYLTIGQVEDPDDALNWLEAVLEAYLFGVYGVIELVDDAGDSMARGLVLEYTPRDLVGVKNSLKLREDRARDLLLRDVFGDEGAEKIRDKIGKATAQKYTALRWKFEEGGEK